MVVVSTSDSSGTIYFIKLTHYSGDLKSNHLKSGLFEGRISNGPVFKWSGFSYQPFEIQTFFVRILNGWASGFQIPFEIQTICNPTCFGPFEIQTRSDFRSPLY